jgi:ATP-dependent RNA helicase DDX41
MCAAFPMVPVIDFEKKHIVHCSKKFANNTELSKTFELTKENVDKMMNFRLFKYENYCKTCTEYVKPEGRMTQLLDCLQKTAPPVLIFAEKKQDVDAIHEFLLLKSVEAVSIHGGKTQEERTWAVDKFKAQEKDVLVATDIASKGLDFPDIQHVINYDMPEDIENYVHRIGRTGRKNRTGMATTFVNKLIDEALLLDLKHLLMEAKQKIPEFLQTIGGDMDLEDEPGCTYCGGLGHRITNCPKLEAQQSKTASNLGKKEYLAKGSADY